MNGIRSAVVRRLAVSQRRVWFLRVGKNKSQKIEEPRLAGLAEQQEVDYYLKLHRPPGRGVPDWEAQWKKNCTLEICFHVCMKFIKNLVNFEFFSQFSENNHIFLLCKVGWHLCKVNVPLPQRQKLVWVLCCGWPARHLIVPSFSREDLKKEDER